MKFFLSIILFITFCTPLGARELSYEQALGNNWAFFSKIGSRSSMELIDTGSIDGKRCYYVTSVGGERGFAIIAANDVARPLLAYCPDVAYNAQQLPQGMAHWLRGYCERIAMASNEGDTELSYPLTKPREDVAPLLRVTWRQTEPFYNQCPMFEGRRCVVGCVATAMTEVMATHRWPSQCRGSRSYHAEKIDRDFSEDFSTLTIDWSNILPNYWSGYTQEQADEVAKLSYFGAVSVEMNFHPDGSGAYTSNTMRALVENFDYDPHLAMLSRDQMDRELYEEILYSELKAGRPVLYDGFPGTGEDGHAFVIDGYRAEDDLYHLDWGWYGGWNGYFAIDCLKPGRDYACGNCMVIGIQPPKEETRHFMYCTDGFSVELNGSSDQQALLKPFGMTGNWFNPDSAAFMNCSFKTFQGEIGLLAVNDINQADTLLLALSSVNWKQFEGVPSLNFDTRSFPVGCWSLYPIYKETGRAKWEKFVINSSPNACAYLTIDAQRNDIKAEQSRRRYYPPKMDWDSLGTGTLTDGLMEDLWPEVATGIFPAGYNSEVSVSEARTSPGVYLVTGGYKDWFENAYAEIGDLAYENAEDFMVIDASKPDSVVIKESSTGLYSNAGRWGTTFASKAWNNIRRDSVPGEAPFGTINGNIISFPTNSIEVEGFEYVTRLANSSGRMQIKVPFKSGITDLKQEEEGQIRYFDLMGREVLDPRSGIFIEKRGRRTRKVLISN